MAKAYSMETTQMTIGQALAFLDVEKTNGIRDWPQLSSVEKAFLFQLRQRLGSIGGCKAAEKIIQSLPESSCNDWSCIDGNRDFFLSCLIMRHNNEAQEPLSNQRFFKHLNSCCRCFEIFARELREYFYQYRILTDYNKNKLAC